MDEPSAMPDPIDALVVKLSPDVTGEELDQLTAAVQKITRHDSATTAPPIPDGDHFLDEGRAELSALAMVLATKYPQSEPIAELTRRYPRL